MSPRVDMPVPGPIPRPARERLLAKVKIVGECWIWTGAKVRGGYGGMRVGSTIDGSRRKITAHRASWEILVGRPIPDGLCVLHRCDTPPCINPAHLFLGTKKDNAVDMAAKGRCPAHVRPETVKRGEECGSAKLTAEAVAIIRTSKEPRKLLATRLGISESAIKHVRAGRTWRHVL